MDTSEIVLSIISILSNLFYATIWVCRQLKGNNGNSAYAASVGVKF